MKKIVKCETEHVALQVEFEINLSCESTASIIKKKRTSLKQKEDELEELQDEVSSVECQIDELEDEIERLKKKKKQDAFSERADQQEINHEILLSQNDFKYQQILIEIEREESVIRFAQNRLRFERKDNSMRGHFKDVLSRAEKRLDELELQKEDMASISPIHLTKYRQDPAKQKTLYAFGGK